MADLASKTDGPIEEIVQDVEDLFKPRAGGMVERAREERARRQAAEEAARNAAEPVQETAYKGVKVVILSPEITSTNVVNVLAGGTAMILPNSEYRYRATIKATAPATFCKDAGQALGAVGYPYAVTDPPFVTYSRAQLWVFCAGATTVSIISESYAPNA
jgi:ribosomal protein S11